MPDSYTHASIATQALLRGSQAVASLPCYLAGANGPDPFFYAQFWQKSPQPDLAALASRMHKERTGPFLGALLENAITPQQQSYTLGFLTHYATDCTLNPYISAMGDAGFFAGKAARAGFEASLDSALFYKNYRCHTVPLYASTPMLFTEDLGQVAALLHEALLVTYGLDIPTVVLSDAFHENAALRKRMISPRGGRRLWARLSAPARLGHLRAQPWLARFQPGQPLPHLPETWKNPYTGDEMHLTFDEVIVLAEETSAACVVSAMRYWLGEMDAEQLAGILGNNSYLTGLPQQEEENTPSPEEEPAALPQQEAPAPPESPGPAPTPEKAAGPKNAPEPELENPWDEEPETVVVPLPPPSKH